MNKRIIAAAIGLALSLAPIAATAQSVTTVGSMCSSNATVECLQQEVQQLLQILSAHIASRGAAASTAPVSSSTPSLIASNPEQLGYSIAAGGATNVPVGTFTLQSSGEPVSLQYAALVLTSNRSSSPADLTRVYLYNGTTLLGTTMFSGPPSNLGTYYATTTLTTPVIVTPGQQSTFTIKADISNVGVGQAGTAGDNVVVGLANAHGAGTNSGTSVDSGPISYMLTGGGVGVFKSYPVITPVPLAHNTLVSGNSSIMRFSVSAGSSGSIGIYKFGLKIAGSQTKLTLPQYAVYSDPAFSLPVPGYSLSSNGVTYATNAVSSSGVFSGGNVSMSLGGSGHALEIPAGTTYYFDIRDSVTPTGSAPVISTTLLGDQSYQGLINANGADALASNFFWSPNDGGVSQFSDSDWTDGYGVIGLPPFGITQSLAGDVGSTCSNGYRITSTSPCLSLSATPTSGSAPLTVSFSGAVPYPYLLDFGDGSMSPSPVCDPGPCASPINLNLTHTYASAGTYTSALTSNQKTLSTATITVSAASTTHALDNFTITPTVSCLSAPTTGDVLKVTWPYALPNNSWANVMDDAHWANGWYASNVTGLSSYTIASTLQPSGTAANMPAHITIQPGKTYYVSVYDGKLNYGTSPRAFTIPQCVTPPVATTCPAGYTGVYPNCVAPAAAHALDNFTITPSVSCLSAPTTNNVITVTVPYVMPTNSWFNIEDDSNSANGYYNKNVTGLISSMSAPSGAAPSNSVANMPAALSIQPGKTYYVVMYDGSLNYGTPPKPFSIPLCGSGAMVDDRTSQLASLGAALQRLIDSLSGK